MGKITSLTNVFPALLAGIFSIGTLHAAGPDSDESLPLPRFRIEIAGGFDHAVSKITENHSLITAADGTVESDLTAGKDDLRRLNRQNTYKLDQQSVDLRLSYRIYRRMYVWAGVGVANTSTSVNYAGDDDALRAKSVSANPEFLLKGGLNYTHPLGGGFFVGLRPAVAYSNCDNTLLMLYPQEGEESVYHNYDLNRKVLRWEIPLIAGKQLGRFTPYVGVAYKDFRETDRMETETIYLDQTYQVSATDIYRSRSKVHGLAGTTFSLAPNIGIGLTATFSRSIAAELAFHLSL